MIRRRLESCKGENLKINNPDIHSVKGTDILLENLLDMCVNGFI